MKRLTCRASTTTLLSIGINDIGGHIVTLDQMLKLVATETGISLPQVKRTATLLEEGNTVPFIARYRKEMTGTLDENQIRQIQDRLAYLKNLEERKEEVIRLIDEQGKLTEALQKAIAEAGKLQEVEDLYRPYKQKRRTRATMAKEKGLEPLAMYLLQLPSSGDPLKEAARYINEEKQVLTAEDAMAGAMDIAAEQVADEPSIRQWIRHFTKQRGLVVTEKKADESEDKNVYEMYYAFSEPVHFKFTNDGTQRCFGFDDFVMRRVRIDDAYLK